MPCLNEAETLRNCITTASEALKRAGIYGEIVIADNGSTDGSQEIARQCGARVVNVPQRGYGNALQGGIAAAEAKYILMGDSDESHDFSHIPRFFEQLSAGADLVVGNRFHGGIAKGAMPFLHRYLGNPVLTGIGRLLFRVPVGDIYCGFRAFTRDAYHKMDIRSTGMEFAVEMVVKGTVLGMKVTEVPTTQSPAGRSRPPHMRPWKDGWRTIRFFLVSRVKLRRRKHV